MTLSASTVCISRRVMRDHTRSRLSVELGHEPAVVRNAVREDVGDRNLEGDREEVEAREDVCSGRTPRPGDAAEVVGVQVDQVEDALLIELIGIVELAGDDPAAVRQIVDEGVDERLIVETDFTAGGITGVVPLERAETVDEPIGLRAVVVRKDREIPAQDLGIIVIVSRGRPRCARSRRCA